MLNQNDQAHLFKLIFKMYANSHFWRKLFWTSDSKKSLFHFHFGINVFDHPRYSISYNVAQLAAKLLEKVNFITWELINFDIPSVVSYICIACRMCCISGPFLMQIKKVNILTWALRINTSCVTADRYRYLLRFWHFI